MMKRLWAMKRWKKWTLLLLLLVLLSQSPFIYRRFQLRQLSLSIERLNRSRVANASDAYADYKGVIHVHSSLGGHSTGSLAEIIEAARQNSLDFVVMTEHPTAQVDTAMMPLYGFHGSTLIIGGNEVSTTNGDRLLVMPGSPSASAANTRQTQDLIMEERGAGRSLFVAYPEDFKSWDASDYEGIEVYNLYTNARRINPLLMFFDGLWSYGSYPELLFSRFYARPAESLRRWDEQTVSKNKRLAAIAGNDAHQNVGIHLGDAGGKKYFQILLDPYERSFRIVRTHALIEKDSALSNTSLLEAIRNGHCYIAFDLFSDATGFRFTADNGSERKIMGDRIAFVDGMRLKVSTPIKGRIRLFRNGEVKDEAPAALEKDFSVNERGVYRVEVYLDQLGDSFRDRPWIISNPIYVQ